MKEHTQTILDLLGAEIAAASIIPPVLSKLLSFQIWALCNESKKYVAGELNFKYLISNTAGARRTLPWVAGLLPTGCVAGLLTRQLFYIKKGVVAPVSLDTALAQRLKDAGQDKTTILATVANMASVAEDKASAAAAAVNGVKSTVLDLLERAAEPLSLRDDRFFSNKISCLLEKEMDFSLKGVIEGHYNANARQQVDMVTHIDSINADRHMILLASLERNTRALAYAALCLEEEKKEREGDDPFGLEGMLVH